MGIELNTDPTTVQIRLGGVHGVLAIKRHLDIPTHLITSVEAMDRRVIPPGQGTWLRAPGTYIPGLIRYGSYSRAPYREFWAVFRQRRVLVITIRDWEYSRVVLGIPDPDTHAGSISTTLA